MRGVMRFSKFMGKSGDPQKSITDSAPPPLDASDLGLPDAAASPNDNAFHSPAARALPAHLTRSQRLKSNLEGALDRVHHAQCEAEQIFDLMAQFDAKARLMDDLSLRIKELSQILEEERFRTADLDTRNSELSRELARAHEEAARSQECAEGTRKEMSALYLTQQREADTITTLLAKVSALRSELETANEVKERAEVDGSGLRAALAEREHALSALQGKESEWRLQAEKDRGQMAELVQTAERKERRLAELGGTLEKSAKRIEELEDRAERAREEQRQLDIRYNDLNVSTESRIYTLNGSLSQEQAGHRVTRKLLEEMRASSQNIADDNKQLKDQAVNLAQENQQMKLELGGTRGTIRDYAERLGEVNLRLAAAQDDIERLEGIAADGKKDARRLKRRANKVDDLQTENASLHDKIKSLQHTLDQYRAVGSFGGSSTREAPIRLTPRRAQNEGPINEGPINEGTPPRTETAPIAKIPRAT